MIFSAKDYASLCFGKVMPKNRRGLVFLRHGAEAAETTNAYHIDVSTELRLH